MPYPVLFSLLLVVTTWTNLAIGQDAKTKPKRARLPSPSSLVTDVFFKDAFAEGLVGPRPATLGGLTRDSFVTERPQANNELHRFEWSSVVSAQTLEDAVKTLQIELQKSITTPSKFSGGGYLEARRKFTELAILFAVIDEYDVDVRWKDDAAAARELFARAAANTKTASIQAFNEASKRKLDLEQLVRGGRLQASSKNDEPSWELINRAALMQRFTQSYDDGLAIWTANHAVFRQQASSIKRESELLMMLAVVLTQAGMADSDDEDYVAYSKHFGTTARQLFNAQQDGDAEAARKAASAMGQSCTACHEDYRGS